MKNTNNKSINYGLKILTILAFVFIFMPFNNASAETLYGSGANMPGPIINPPQPVYIYVPAPQHIYVAPTVAPTTVIYSSTVNPHKVIVKKVVKAKTNNTTANTTPAPSTTNSDNNGLAANAIFGSNSFLPSGLVQWIFFAILVLLIVILTRRIFGAKENYHAAPMKHE